MAFTFEINSKAIDFGLLGHDGRNRTFFGKDGVRGPNGSLIFFTCNHCPFVQNSEERMERIYERCAGLGISMTAIHSNETANHPEDSFELVKERMASRGFRWNALHDHTQLVARAFGAERTPHFFLFDKEDTLVYSGRLDNSPRDPSKAETHELADAIDAMSEGRPVAVPVTKPIGCNIKWWDKDKHWMPNDACDLDYLYARRWIADLS